MARRLLPCGTEAAYIRHLRTDGPGSACVPCLDAWKARGERQRRAAGIPVKERVPIECGTVQGHRAHRRRKTVPCKPCTTALAVDRKAARNAFRVACVARAMLTA